MIDFGGPEPKKSVWELGVLYGLNSEAAHGSASVAAGISFVGGVDRGAYLGSGEGWFSSGNYEKKTFFTVGIPIETRLFLKPIPGLGIGLLGFADINNRKTVYGLQFCIRLMESPD